ncbi:Maf family protein [Dokdonella immobilis]|uniref:7-methyl-GTP pyrophosphatase n=1 Tax=Dokdonella immobilis TaxID=578942 RepID=A0A1I4VVL4_9GAMM|nr:Maf family nucleotide pyrophosphatase [Dokdonella immobilis]SFN05220.1 septum formation protein [Dokdonella immobilis]
MSGRGPTLVLASTSPYRAQMLGRVVADFRSMASHVDETPRDGELPRDTALRLAIGKARAVAADCTDSLVIGSDQVAELDARPLGKPGTAERAFAQLRQSSGRMLSFHTALCVVDTRAGAMTVRSAIDTTRVHFRELGDAEIHRYLELERPFDCAGSFKVEGRGIALFERIESDDPSALVGLPLIALCRLLREAGLAIP